MREITQAIELQLRSLWQMERQAMRTDLSLPSWIASCVPLNDSVRWIQKESVEVEFSQAEPEHATIEIETIQPLQKMQQQTEKP